MCAKNFFYIILEVMRINSLNFNNFSAYKSEVNFGTTNRTLYEKRGGKRFIDKKYKMSAAPYGKDYYLSGKRVIYSNATCFLRGDLCGKSNTWENFTNIILKCFPKDEKINVYDFGCSDGSEAYSIAFSLIEKEGDGAKRFFPIKAIDRDPEIIKDIQNGTYAKEIDLKKIDAATKNNKDKYFIISKSGREFLLKPKEILRRNIRFRTGDFVQELNNITGKNNLIFCRNFWRYLSEDEIRRALEKLSKLDPSTRIVLGSFDLCTDCETGRQYPPKFFEEYGFVKDGTNFILKKSDIEKPIDYKLAKRYISNYLEPSMY
ncbi:MAG: hypothetical protein E7Z91_04460 [Cyanobacteria bacterium SIG30]|nr:hypothetical protein [Cyanobacteria bacterium SIG30]